VHGCVLPAPLLPLESPAYNARWHLKYYAGHFRHRRRRQSPSCRSTLIVIMPLLAPAVTMATLIYCSETYVSLCTGRCRGAGEPGRSTCTGPVATSDDVLSCTGNVLAYRPAKHRSCFNWTTATWLLRHLFRYRLCGLCGLLSRPLHSFS